MDEEKRVSGNNKPYLVSLEKGKRYAWCACGHSQRQPFCDGSHDKTDIKPIVFAAEKTEDLLLCGCKQTKSPPFCDGSHNNLQDSYELASKTEIESSTNATLVPPEHGLLGKAVLDGGAFVVTPAPDANGENDALTWRPLITRADGAKHLSLTGFTAREQTPWRVHNGGDTALYIVAGAGAVNVEGVRFSVTPETGVFIRVGEAFRLEPETELRIVAAISPDENPVDWLDEASGAFAEQYPKRCIGVDPTAQEKMADRFYQVLVGSEIGSEEMTQFIGEIPKSRAAFHRHLYEEAIVILSGEGFMWTRNTKAAVKPGDVIYLPPRQEHSLECTVNEGMRLMGVFYPAGSPAINY